MSLSSKLERFPPPMLMPLSFSGSFFRGIVLSVGSRGGGGGFVDSRLRRRHRRRRCLLRLVSQAPPPSQVAAAAAAALAFQGVSPAEDPETLSTADDQVGGLRISYLSGL